MPIVAPFVYVAVHVVQTPRVGFLLTDGMSVQLLGVIGVLEEPSVVAERLLVAGEPTGRRAGPTGIFPLGLGRQVVRPAFFAAESAAKGLGVVPTDIGRGVVGRFLDAELISPGS